MSRHSTRRAPRSRRHACELLECRRLLAGIALDLNYGTDGRAIVELGTSTSSTESVHAAALQPGARVLMVGSTAASEMALVRLAPDGTRDATFGVDGAVRYREGTGAAQANDVIVVPDGRLLVAGYAASPVQPRLLRFFANGRLDATFGNGGAAVTTGPGWLASVALLPDGKILAAGAANSVGTLWRFNPDGSPDTTFGTGGVRTVDLGGGGSQSIRDLTVLPDGRFLARTVLGIARFAADGTRDLTFGGGAGAIEVNSKAHARLPEGSIVTVSDVDSPTIGLHWRVARYGADGLLDATFGQQGYVALGTFGSDIPASIVTQPDGKILVGGRFRGTDSDDVALFRLHGDGTPDQTFGTAGVLVDTFPRLSSREHVVELLPVDGHTLYAAVVTSLSPDAQTSSGANFAAVRYRLDVPLTVDPGGPFPAVEEGATIAVSASGSSYPGGSIVSYEWAAPYRLGAFKVAATGVTANLPAPDGPSVTVALRVTTSDGLQAVTSRVVTVNNVAPTVDAPALRTFAQGVSGEFTGRIIDPGQDRWTVRVDFGDGTTPWYVDTPVREFSLAHAYAQPGTYPVSITVTDDDGGATTFQANADVARLAGRVFRDNNDNTVFSPTGDEGFAGQTVWLDLDQDGVLDGDEPQATTDAAGDYSFDGLSAGAYRVRVVAPSGWLRSAPIEVDYRDVTVGAAQGARADFGFTRRARIVGFAYRDANANGVRDPGEAGWANPFYLDLNDNGLRDSNEPEEHTDGVSPYRLRNLAPGTYAVRATLQGDRAQTAPPVGQAQLITVGAAAAATAADFGISPQSRVTGQVFEDRNRNGVRDPGENVYLITAYADLNQNGARDPGEPRSTNFYELGNLPPGTYHVRFHQPGTVQTFPANNAAHVVTVGLGQTVSNRNFGFTFDDFVAPTISDAALLKDVVSHQLRVRFDEFVTVAPLTSSFRLTNLTTGQPVAAGAVSTVFNQHTNTMTYTFPGLPNATLPDGRYRATVLAAGVEDFAGNRMAADVDVDFHVLAGDANGDATVNLQDFDVLAANFGQINRVFSEGDFNYDGQVNLRDFNLLAARFGGAVAPGGALPPPGGPSRGADDDDEGEERSDPASP